MYNENHVFTLIEERDAYFDDNPSELVSGLYVSVDGISWQYLGTTWILINENIPDYNIGGNKVLKQDGTWTYPSDFSPIFKTEEYTILVGDKHIICNSTSPFTLYIHASTGIGVKHTITNINSGQITIDPDSTETINGETTWLLDQWDSIDIYDYDTGEWVII